MIGVVLVIEASFEVLSATEFIMSDWDVGIGAFEPVWPPSEVFLPREMNGNFL
jgi:hypothetical protein